MASTLACALLVLLGLAAPAASREPLFDFEAGAEGWWTNPWGGGAIDLTISAGGPFGSALHATWRRGDDGRLNANLIAPYLPAEATWRERDLGSLRLWYRTAGEAEFRFSLTDLPAAEGDELSFSQALPPSAEWRSIDLFPRALWNRQKQRLDLRRLGRLIVNASQPGELWLDQITLLPAARQLPLQPLPEDLRLLTSEPGVYQLEASLPPGAAWSARIAHPDGAAAEAAGVADNQPLLALTVPAAVEGEAELTVTTPAGQRRFTFPLLLPVAPVEIAPLGLFPTPVELSRQAGGWQLPEPLTGRLTGPGASETAALLRRRLDARYALPTELTVADGEPGFVLGDCSRPELPADLPAEGYALRVTPSGAAVAARDARGQFNGALSLLRLLRQASARSGPLVVPAVEVVDWPAVPIRACSLILPTTRWGHPNNPVYAVDDFLAFLDQMVVDGKLNLVVLQGLNGVRSEVLPALSSPNAWTPDDLRQVVDFLRANLIEPVPSHNSFGHASWLLSWRRDLADVRAEQGADGSFQLVPDTQTIDPLQPDAWPTLVRFYEEVAVWCQPRWFHAGLDEVRWQTHRIPSEFLGERPGVAAKAPLLGDWLNRIHAWWAARGVRVMIWTDMLTAGHNGGAPYHTARLLPQAPRDLVMCNWSSTYDPMHTYELRDLGFQTVLEANSPGINRERAQAVAGSMSGIWAKNPWLTESTELVTSYTYHRLLHASEYSWRPHPDLDQPKPAVTSEFLAAAAKVEAARVLRRERAAGELHPLDPPAGDAPATGLDAAAREVALAGLTVPIWPRALIAGAELGLRRRGAALYWLQVLRLTDEQRQALGDAFRDPAHIDGVPLAELVVTLADGRVLREPIRYGWDLRDQHPGPLPACYGAVGWQAVSGADGSQQIVYLRQWIHPEPQAMIESIRLEAAPAAIATPWLVGAVLAETH